MTDAARDIAALIADGRKIEAIKRVREVTGLGLADAKHLVERLEAGEAVELTPRPSGAVLSDEVRALADQGKLLEAIRLLREQTGCGLKEAKDRIELTIGKKIRPTLGCGATTALLLLGLVALLGMACR